jgi:futalosine hydrolase
VTPTGGAILVVCALRAELRGFTAPSGVDVLASGVGPVEAAAETARALASGRYRAAINAGIAGAFRGRARVGEAVLVAEERMAGLGLEGGTRMALPGGATLVDRAFADDDLLAAAGGVALRTVCGVTVTTVTATDETALRLAREYDGDVESMEGFAVLRACERAGVPALEIRGISNYVGERSRSEWDFPAGAKACGDALAAVLATLRR